jgi:proteasome alpha subunit
MDSIKEHQQQGYDRHVGMFSPDGLLLQVEYAEKAVKLGASVLAITYKDGILFVADRKIKSKLLVRDSFRKIFEVDKTITITGSGVMSDGRRLIEQAQEYAKKHQVQFENQVDVISLVKDIANIQQYYSQSGGLRPFGVALLIGAIEDGKVKLFQTRPSGVYMQFKAICCGNLSDKINKELEEKYKDNMTKREAINLALSLFKNVKKEFDKKNFEIKFLEKNGLKDE